MIKRNRKTRPGERPSMSRSELEAAGIPVCRVEGCDGIPHSRPVGGVRGYCRQCHPRRCLGWVAPSSFTLPADEEEGRCRNLTTHASGRCHLHRNHALEVVTAVELKGAA